MRSVATRLCSCPRRGEAFIVFTFRMVFQSLKQDLRKQICPETACAEFISLFSPRDVKNANWSCCLLSPFVFPQSGSAACSAACEREVKRGHRVLSGLNLHCCFLGPLSEKHACLGLLIQPCLAVILDPRLAFSSQELFCEAGPHLPTSDGLQALRSAPTAHGSQG